MEKTPARNSVAPLWPEAQCDRLLRFWTEQSLDGEANCPEIPFANQVASPPLCPVTWPHRSRVRQEWVSICRFLWMGASGAGALIPIQVPIVKRRFCSGERLLPTCAGKIQTLYVARSEWLSKSSFCSREFDRSEPANSADRAGQKHSVAAKGSQRLQTTRHHLAVAELQLT